MSEVTKLLTAIDEGDRAAADQLLPLVYRELRSLATARMSHEKAGQTIQATALVHEAYLRLVEPKSSQKWNSRGHFFGAAAEAMRRILVERARHKATIRAGGDRQRVELPDDVAVGADSERLDLLELDEALKKLEETEPRRTKSSSSVSLQDSPADKLRLPSTLPVRLLTPTGPTLNAGCGSKWEEGFEQRLAMRWQSHTALSRPV